jgi:hypothetical protein
VRDGVTVTAESKRKGCDENREKMHRLLIDLFEILEVNPHAFDYLKGNPRRGRDNPEPDVAAAPRAEGKDTDR